jgi:hypothetical protein
VDDERPATSGRPASNRSSLGIDLGVALVAATVWALSVALRLGTTAPLVFLGATGSSALTLGALLVAARRARPVSETVRVVILGALGASGPLSVLGSVIQTKTHHRALGAVAFALAAVFVVAFFSLVVRRLRQVERRGVAATSALLLVSAGWMTRALLQPAALAQTLDSVTDALIGIALFVAALSVPRAAIPTGLAKVGIGAWLLAVTGGLSVLVRNVPVRAELAARAPVTLGAAQVLPDP